MTQSQKPRKIPKSRIILMIGIDVVAIVIAIASYLWFAPRDTDAALMAVIAAVVFGGFFNLVIALVSIKP